MHTVDSHASWPAFQRMLVLFPGFTKTLVLQINDPEHFSGEKIDMELGRFAAYQLMFRLIDRSDYGYLKEDTPDEWYMRG